MKNNIHKINNYIYVTSEDVKHKTDDYISNGLGIFKAVKGTIPTILWHKIILTNDPDLTTVQQLTPEEVNYLNGVDSREFEKVDIGYKLLISIEKTKENELFNYLHDLGTVSLDSEIQEIERIVLKNKTLYPEIEIIKAFENGLNCNVSGVTGKEYLETLKK